MIPLTVNAGVFGEVASGFSLIGEAWHQLNWWAITPLLTMLGGLFKLVTAVINRKTPMHWMIRTGVFATIMTTLLFVILMLMIQFDDLFEAVGEYVAELF